MNQRVLVFENDSAFADDVKRNFERMGLAVDVALDGPTGLELAHVHRPDLILLSIELPGMNGFLVCKKIKKIAELEHVPLVIMSSEVDQETFEQHKKLRTRADEYIRKPIAFTELLDRIRGYVPATNGHANDTGAAQAADIEEAFSVGDDEVIVLSDEDAQNELQEVENTDPGLDVAGPPLSVGTTNDDFDREQQAAIEALAAPGAATLSSRPPPPPMAANNQAFSNAEERRTPPPNMTSSLRPGAVSVRPAGESALAVAAHAAEIERFKRELTAADEKVQASDRRAAMAEQRATGAEKALESAKRTGGASSRELLDLREQLNRKDRELLELRDQVTSRDKQLIEASDRHLGVERELQDARDKMSDLQRDLEKKSELVVALTADKETARKRLDDAKARAERNETKVRELSSEVDELRVQQEAELLELNSQRQAAETALRSEHAATLEGLKSQHASELERMKQAQLSEVDRLTGRHVAETEARAKEHAQEIAGLKDQHASTLAARQRAHEDELAELREEHVVAQKSAAERAEQEKLAALEALREELNGAHAERMAEAERKLRSEHADEREGMARRHANEVSELTERHRLEASRLNKALTDAEARFALLEERFEDSERARTSAETQLLATRQERDHLSARSNELSGQLTRAEKRIERDNELLERVRKAMAIGLGLLEEQKQDPAS